MRLQYRKYEFQRKPDFDRIEQTGSIRQNAGVDFVFDLSG